MIWSSSQQPTVDALIAGLFEDFPERRSKIIAEWGRTKLGLTPSQFNRKVKVYKNLETVWADRAIQAKYPIPQSTEELGADLFKRAFAQANEAADNRETFHSLPFRWNQSNTVLIDDSSYKASGQPYNIIEVPEFKKKSNSAEANIFPMLLQKLKELSTSDDVSRTIRFWNMESPDIADLKESCDEEIQGGVRVEEDSRKVHADILTLATSSSSKNSKKNRKKKAKAARRASLHDAQGGQRELVAPPT
ncbi:hypothetical protein V8E54_008688 [Elaphomyces granulatus]